MQKRDWILWTIVAGIFISLSLPIILPDVNEFTTVVIAPVAAGVMMLIFKQYFFDGIPYSTKEEHTKNICKVYMLLTRVGIKQGRRNDSLWKRFLRFPTEYKPVAGQIVEELLDGVHVEQIYEDQLGDHPAYLHYDSALEHLKKHRKYKPIYKHWENTKTMLDELNSKTGIEERLEGVIKEKMHRYFPALQSFALGKKSSDFYDMDYIVKFMMKYFNNLDGFSRHALDSLVCNKSGRNKFVYSQWYVDNPHITVNSDSKIDFKTYKKLVKEMQEDDSLNDFYNEYENERCNIIKELTYFQDELEELVKDLKRGKLIEGKCDVGF